MLVICGIDCVRRPEMWGEFSRKRICFLVVDLFVSFILEWRTDLCFRTDLDGAGVWYCHWLGWRFSLLLLITMDGILENDDGCRWFFIMDIWSAVVLMVAISQNGGERWRFDCPSWFDWLPLLLLLFGCSFFILVVASLTDSNSNLRKKSTKE